MPRENAGPNPTLESVRDRITFVMTDPQHPGNVGAAARVLDNLGFAGRLVVTGGIDLTAGEAVARAKHARQTLLAARRHVDLTAALESLAGPDRLVIGASARVSSPGRPHPTPLPECAERAVQRLCSDAPTSVVLVFGREDDGLTNSELAQCDWLLTIPTPAEYRVFNLSQAMAVVAWEFNRLLLDAQRRAAASETGASADALSPQRARLGRELAELASDCNFAFPGDPHRLRARLEAIIGATGWDESAVKTLHGLVRQARATIRDGAPPVRRKYQRRRKPD